MITVVIPVYNESKYIVKTIESVLKSVSVSKILIIDGGSTDDSLDLVKLNYMHFGEKVEIINNSSKFVPFAFNIGLSVVQTEYIALIGAHAEYSDNYFDVGLNTILEFGCDAVGGRIVHMGTGKISDSIAFAMSSKFGVGNTAFRTSFSREYVDSAVFAIYKVSVCKEIGGYNEQMIRNNDDEFHYRLNRLGYKIILEPNMVVSYYVRESLFGLLNQYFYYGYFKPAVFWRNRSSIRLRHVIPSLFVLFLVTTLLLPTNIVTLIPIFAYIFSLFYHSFSFSFELLILRILSFFSIHVAYGTGFIIGIFRMFN